MLTTRRTFLRVVQPSRRVHVNSLGLGSLMAGNPTSFYYRPPRGDTPAALVNLLIATQKRHYGKTTLEEHFSNNSHILVRHAKLLLDKYPADRIKRAIHYAAWLSDYPYSFSLVERSIEHLEKYYGV